MQSFYLILVLLGSVAMFLFGLSLLSGGLQRVAGDGLRACLASMTSTPVKRVLTGVAVTAVIQSSTATTIMVVSFVNAGLLTLAQAIGVIMGANIGTTVTSWIMALFGFSYDLSTISLPLIAVGFVMAVRGRRGEKMRDLGDIIIGFALFFLGFAQLRSTASLLLDNLDLSGLQAWTHLMAGPFNMSILLFLLIGTVMTICFQSSAATMAIIMLLITTGVIPFEMAAAMILGENIGTTIAANVAASVGNTTSKRAAMAHTVFNLIGVFWVLCLFHPFLKLIGNIVSSFGLPDPNSADLTDTVNAAAIKSSLLYSVTTMHTLFNLTNTALLIWFIPQIERIVSWIIPSNEKEVFRLKYIQGGPLSTAELSLDEAKQEIVNFSDICHRGFLYVRQAVNEKDNGKFADLRSKLIRYEEITDRIEFEIATYLGSLPGNDLSEVSIRRMRGMYRIIGEMESLGDSGESIGRILQRKIDHGKTFDEEKMKRLNRMMDYLEEAYEAMIENLKVPYMSLKDIANARDAEYNINEYRNTLREEHIINIEEKRDYDYQTGVFYMDIIAELEKMGDFIINISEAQIAENE